MRIKETNSILRTLVDSQLRAALSPLFSTGVIMYTTIPVSLVEVMYNQFYQAEITVMPAFEKYKAVRQALTSSDPQHQYLVQANGLVFCTLEELVLKLPLGSTALDNSGVLAKYSTYFELSVKKLFDYISAYSYLSYSKQNGAADKVWEPTVAVRAPATDSPKSGFFELAPVSDAKTANPSRYAKCITVAVAASRQRKNVPFLILSYVQNVESALLVDALYNIVSGTNTSSAALLESLDKLYEEPDYIEDRAQKTFVHDLTNIPPLFATLYLRLLLAAIVLAPSATLTVADRVGTLAGVDAGVRDAYTKFLTKTKYVSTRRSQRNDLVFETNKLIVNFENVVGADDQDLTVKPEFFTDLVNLAEFPRISDYIVPAANARANSAKSSSGEMLFSRASQKSALAASSFQGANNGLLGRIALLHTVGSGLGHLIVAANHLVSPPNSSVYTMHPLVMDLRQLVINFS